MHAAGGRRRQEPLLCQVWRCCSMLTAPCLLQTIENTREKDETMVQPDDAEVAAGAPAASARLRAPRFRQPDTDATLLALPCCADEDQDEFAEHFQRVRPPNVLITTSYKVTSVMYRFISELLEVRREGVWVGPKNLGRGWEPLRRHAVGQPWQQAGSWGPCSL